MKKPQDGNWSLWYGIKYNNIDDNNNIKQAKYTNMHK